MEDKSSLDIAQLLSNLLALRPGERARDILETGNADDILPDLIEEAGRCVIADLDRALSATQCLVELSDTLAGQRVRSQAHRARAQALAYANRLEEALATFHESIELAEQVGDSIAAAKARMSMLQVLDRLGRCDESIEAGEAARTAFLAEGETEWAAKADANLGVAHRVRNEPARALEHFDRAKAALASNPMSAAQLDSNRAEALLDLNEFSRAEEAFRTALQSFQTAGVTRAAALVEGNLADLMSRQGRLGGALYHFELARRHFEAQGADSDLARVARLQAEQAEALARSGLIDETFQAYSDAIPRLDEHGLTFEAARARTGLGLTLHRLRRNDEADATLAQAVAAFRSLKHDAGYARVRLVQGEIAMSRGDLGQADDFFNQALPLLHDQPAEEAVVRHYLAINALSRDDLSQTERLLKAAIDVAEQYNLAPLLADLHHTRAKLRLAQQRCDEALSDLRTAANQVERLRGSLQAERLRAAFLGQRADVYEDLVATLLADGDKPAAEEAFCTVEQAKSRALLDLVAGAIDVDALPGNESDDPTATRLLKQIAQLHGELNALYSRVEDMATPDRGLETMQRWRERVEQTERKLQTLEGRIAATRGLGGVFAPSIDLATTQQVLDPTTALIEYFIANDRLIGFVVRANSMQTFTGLAPLADLSEQIELLQFQIGRAVAQVAGGSLDSDTTLIRDAQRELADLYAILIEPLAGALHDANKLIIVPHGPLHAVPFHALHDGERYLIEEYEISYSPSASLLQYFGKLPSQQSQPHREQFHVVLGFADEIAPHIDEEVRCVAQTLGNAHLFVGESATKANLAAAARDATIVHLACHARFTPDAPLSSGLKLADGWMTVRDLYSLQLNAPLVVLSGCDTAAAVIGQADELIGIIRGFVAAGASALVMSLWTLNDDTAKITVANLYQLWHNGSRGRRMTLPAALRSAQCEMLKTRPHPVFWAPLVLVGIP